MIFFYYFRRQRYKSLNRTWKETNLEKKYGSVLASRSIKIHFGDPLLLQTNLIQDTFGNTPLSCVYILCIESFGIWINSSSPYPAAFVVSFALRILFIIYEALFGLHIPHNSTLFIVCVDPLDPKLIFFYHRFHFHVRISRILSPLADRGQHIVFHEIRDFFDISTLPVHKKLLHKASIIFV